MTSWQPPDPTIRPLPEEPKAWQPPDPALREVRRTPREIARKLVGDLGAGVGQVHGPAIGALHGGGAQLLNTESLPGMIRNAPGAVAGAARGLATGFQIGPDAGRAAAESGFDWAAERLDQAQFKTLARNAGFDAWARRHAPDDDPEAVLNDLTREVAQMPTKTRNLVLQMILEGVVGSEEMDRQAQQPRQGRFMGATLRDTLGSLFGGQRRQIPGEQ